MHEERIEDEDDRSKTVGWLVSPTTGGLDTGAIVTVSLTGMAVPPATGGMVGIMSGTSVMKSLGRSLGMSLGMSEPKNRKVI